MRGLMLNARASRLGGSLCGQVEAASATTRKLVTYTAVYTPHPPLRRCRRDGRLVRRLPRVGRGGDDGRLQHVFEEHVAAQAVPPKGGKSTSLSKLYGNMPVATSGAGRLGPLWRKRLAKARRELWARRGSPKARQGSPRLAKARRGSPVSPGR
eukprot:gene9795-biopygen12776